MKITYNIIYSLLFAAGLLIIISSCNQKAKEESCKMDDVNPNGASALALLMREMTTHVELNKANLLAGKQITSKPENISTLLTAERTDKNLDDKLFVGLAKVYLQRLDELQNAPDSLKIEVHNNLVTSCHDCHSNFCPGPIKRINKAMISDSEIASIKK
jgi:hypothetical protein